MRISAVLFFMRPIRGADSSLIRIAPPYIDRSQDFLPSNPTRQKSLANLIDIQYIL
jgi:hypothetical protein